MRLLLPGSLLVLSLATIAPAQVFEIGMFGGPNRTSNNEIGTISADPTTGQLKLGGTWKLGFRATLNSGRFFGNEFGYAYNRTQLKQPDVEDQGMAIHQGFYNFLLYGLPEGSRIRPFATGGVHFNNYVPPGSSAANGGGSTKFGYNYGGGVKVRVSSLFLIRLDVRQYQTGKPFSLPNQNGLFKQLEVTAGFSLAL
ncbi:MAG: outer membrane beta-barrel protein [Bryobacteraceae bacterium]